MKKDKSQPFVLYVAEKIYSHVYELKKKDPGISNIDAIERFMGTSLYEEISTVSVFLLVWITFFRFHNFPSLFFKIGE